MTNSISKNTTLEDYAFDFDALPQRVVFTRQINITGWLLHRGGLPIYGIRGIVRNALRNRSTFRARRKRSRPLIAAVYPDLPDAGQSGFLLTLELPAGPSEVTIQVQDHNKNWQTIIVIRTWAFPLTLIGRMGFRRTEQFFVTYFGQLVAKNGRNISNAPVAHPIALPENNPRLDRRQTITRENDSMLSEIETVHLFVTSKSNLFIREIGELLCAGFRAAGFETQLLVDQIPAERTEPGKIQIVVTPHEFFNLFLRDKLPLMDIQRLTSHLFLLSTEQPESEWFDSNLVMAPYARAMLDIHLSGVAAYRALGLRCFHLPLGYDPLLEQKEGSLSLERNIDICLLAAMTDRREEFIGANAAFFAERNCHLRFVPIEYAKTEETRSYLPVPQRNALLQRAKILLNVHYSKLRYFEWHRALVGLANGCCLITESCEGFGPFVPGKHFVMANAESLIECCQYFLEHEDERKKIAGSAYDFMREHITQKENCRAFLGQLEEISRAPQERLLDLHTDVAPIASEPLPDPLTKRLSGKHATRFFSALREDLSNLLHSANQKTSGAASSTDPMDIADHVALLCEKRRGYMERLEIQEQTRERGQPIFRLLDNGRVDGSAPAISVIVTLYNYSAYIHHCLKSLEDSNTAAIPGGIEVVIVNDASTDDSLKHAMALQENSRHPVRIVDKGINTGLADARNIGLQLARAPYVFIMDADNMVFPRALERLHAVIIEHRSTAVYSMLCRFHDVQNGRSGLLSYFDWDLQMLVEYPYIDAMALFDRERLIEIGGYDTELYKSGWFGWEDYDLWLRIAQAGLKVSFLPNVLCLYRHHERAMSNATNFFERELAGHLLEKYRSLIEAYPPKRRILGVNRARFEEALATCKNQPCGVAAEGAEVAHPG